MLAHVVGDGTLVKVMSALGERFRINLVNAVNADGRSLAAIARKSGYGRNYIYRVMKRIKTNPTLQFVEVMSDTLGKDLLDGYAATKNNMAS